MKEQPKDKVRVKFLRGANVGWRTMLSLDVAKIMAGRGEVKIIKAKVSPGESENAEESESNGKIIIKDDKNDSSLVLVDAKGEPLSTASDDDDDESIDNNNNINMEFNNNTDIDI